MQLHFVGTEKGFELRVTVDWKPFKAFIKAAIATMGTVGTIIATSEIIQYLHR